MVRKSNEWIERIEANYGLNKAQLNILAKLASLIHKDDEDFKEYRLKIAPLLKEIGMGEKNYKYLDMITEDMAGKVANVYANGVKTQTGLITAQYPDNEGVLILSFHKSLKPYFLQLKGFFTTYEYYHYLSLNGKHSKRLFELMKLYEFAGSFEKSVSFLRKYFSIPNEKYKKFYHFNRRVIIESIEEIEKKTNIEIELRYLKRGRKVTGYKFWILERGTKKERKKKIEEKPQPVLFSGEDQRDIEIKSLEFAKKELVEINGKIALYEHLRRTGDEDKIKEAIEELKILSKKKRTIEKNIKELKDEISKRK